MPEKSVDELRAELRTLGYLTHGIERWFALDPWSSRTFWAELIAVSSKATLLVSLFAVLPLVSIMVVRNQPVPFRDVSVLFGVYLLAIAIPMFALIVGMALILRSRPTLAIDSPGALTGMSIALAGLVTGAIVTWWAGFGTPSIVELAIGGALIILLLIVGTFVFSAALLSFSIHEARRIPLVAQKDRTVPLSIVAAIMGVAIGAWAMTGSSEAAAEPPSQIVVASTETRLALLGVDGLTWDLFAAQRPDDLALAFATPVSPLAETQSSAERWATLGTGTQPKAHEVRAIEGIRLAGSANVLQAVSRYDSLLDRFAVPFGLAKRVPLPPTVRRRHYVWEILGSRGVRSASVNWWVTDDETTANLVTISQSTIFAAAGSSSEDPSSLALAIDQTALARLDEHITRDQPRFVTAYLPATDIILNRLELDPGARAAASVRAVAQVFTAARHLVDLGYTIVIVGMPGEGDEANAIVAATMPAAAAPVLDSLAPSLLTLMGFPVSEEMSSTLFVDADPTGVIPTYGDRAVSGTQTAPSDDYYESLKSLGYIQ